MSDPKQLTDFPKVSFEDTISVTLASAHDPSLIVFQLESAPSIKGWKGLELRSKDGRIIQYVQTENSDHGPHSISVTASGLIGATLTLAKAKLFGIHTGMYELHNLSTLKGRSLQFLWESDESGNGAILGFFRDLGNGASVAADAAASVVETVIETVGEVISTSIEAIGTVLADGLDAIGNFLSEIPIIGIALKFVFHWLGTIVSAIFSLAATVVNGILDLVANVAAGLIRVVIGGIGGLIAWDGRVFVKGISGIVSGILGAVLAIVGKLLALVQATIFLHLGERPLTAVEADILTRVFRGSIALYNVRVIDGFAGVANINSRPFTLGNKVYMKSTSPTTYMRDLVHECCHVWQYQHEGTRYTTDAIWAQWTLPGQGYSWTDELARGHFLWKDFNKEAQASFLEDVYVLGQKIPTASKQGEFYDDDPIGSDVQFTLGLVDHTGLAQESVAYVRNTKWPLHLA